MTTSLLAIGCYSMKLAHVAGRGKGIHIVALDDQTGAMEPVRIIEGPRNPSYMAISPDRRRLYVVEELDDADKSQLHTYALEAETGVLKLIAKHPSPGSFACHVQVDEEMRHVVIANFVSGDLVHYRLSPDGVPEGAAEVVSRQDAEPRDKKSNFHFSMMMPETNTLMVCDAGKDTLAAYTVTDEGLVADRSHTVRTAPGSFPRHFALGPQDTMIVAHEHAATLGVFRYRANGIEAGEVISSLPADWTGRKSGAAVRVHPNGEFAYMSNRGHDSIFCARIDAGGLKLEAVGNTSTGGNEPRDFALDESGRWMVVANQNSDTLVSFRVDGKSGALVASGHTLETGNPVSVLWL
jgi:6-phosphogluconolactonase